MLLVAILPSASHASYPYGNPYALPISTHATLPLNLLSSTPSLSTTLPVLTLPHLFTLTGFNQPKERSWNELALTQLLPLNPNHLELNTPDGLSTPSEAPQPTGQNAGDHPPNEEDLTGIEED